MPNVYEPEFEDGDRPQGRLPEGGGLRAFFKRDDRVSYWDGERFDLSDQD